MSRVSFPWLAVLALGLGLVLPRIGTAQAPPDARTRSDTVALSPSGQVEIDNHTGSISVTTWDRPQVGYVVSLAPEEEDSVDASDFAVQHDKDEVSFGHEDTWTLNIPGVLRISPGGTSEPIGKYRVVMPATAALEIDDYGSTIEVSGVKGAVDINTHHGTVSVEETQGELDLATFSSAATATGLRNKTELGTHSGQITAVFEEFSEASSADMFSGDLRVYLPSDTGFVLETDADSSRVTIDDAFSLTSRDDERWVFNGGGTALSVETFSGSVELRPLDAYAP